ncbi:MAG TPA: alpha/beta hydrolase [Casimicrobiaceae bacterium]|nr:alpha/beta hydrolase [Casimicrobiaceae bacterium]
MNTVHTPTASNRGAMRARERLLASMPVAERQLELAGIPTSVLETGAGPAIVLLHGPGEYAAKWLRVIPDLASTHHVIAPDLPGHGTSGTVDDADAGRIVAWLGALIEQTCKANPTLVGQLLGGAIAARYAIDDGDRLSRLVLVDAFGLSPFRPAPEFAAALGAFVQAPTVETHDALWRQCAFDLDAMRGQMGESWYSIKAYNLDRAHASSLHATQRRLMELFGMPAIAPTDLARIGVPTTLIWGRQDRATPLAVARQASERYGWPLHVIENAGDDPPMEQPEAFLAALRETRF